MRDEPHTVPQFHIDDCANCDGLTVIYDGLVLPSDAGEIQLDGEVCLDGCDPMLTSLMVRS